MPNRQIHFWAITLPNYHNGKVVGRLTDWSTVKLLRRDAIAAWKGYWPEGAGDAMWDKYRKQHDIRVERVVVTVEEST